MQETIDFLNDLADEAGRIVKTYFRKNFGIEAKVRHDPVTEADKAIEQALRALIKKRYPEDSIQGEEYGFEKGTNSRVWVIDPIDGTRAFAIGRATFTTVVGLCDGGVPIAGLLDQAIMGDRWIGVKGQATLLNGTPCTVRACNTPETARLILTAPEQFKTDHEKQAHAHIRDALGFTAYGGDCYAYGLLASGFADVVLEAGLKAHDIMGLVQTIEGAGGIITDWQGQKITLQNCTGQVLACGDKNLHQRLLSLISA